MSRPIFTLSNIAVTMALYNTENIEIGKLIVEQIEDDNSFIKKIQKHSKSGPTVHDACNLPEGYDFFLDETPEALEMNDFVGGYDYDYSDVE